MPRQNLSNRILHEIPNNAGRKEFLVKDLVTFFGMQFSIVAKAADDYELAIRRKINIHAPHTNQLIRDGSDKMMGALEEIRKSLRFVDLHLEKRPYYKQVIYELVDVGPKFRRFFSCYAHLRDTTQISNKTLDEQQILHQGVRSDPDQQGYFAFYKNTVRDLARVQSAIEDDDHAQIKKNRLSDKLGKQRQRDKTKAENGVVSKS